MRPHLRFDFSFPHDYEVRVLESAPPVHPVEKLYHYPMEMEEGDRTGVYVRVAPKTSPSWSGFFALGFDSDQVVNAVCSCPSPKSFCIIVGGYGYVLNAESPTQWSQIDQRPIMDVRVLKAASLVLFVGFTSITALGASGIAWTTERLSWEGTRIENITEDKIFGLGWDAIANKDAPFEVDLATGKHTGGSRPQD